VNQLNVKWGIDSQHRSSWNYSKDFEDGTWQLAVDRLDRGVAELQGKRNVHFMASGSAVLAKQVAEAITRELPKSTIK
jgi:exonuclease V gamma subunit